MNFLSIDLIVRVTLVLAPVLIGSRVVGFRSAKLSHRLISMALLTCLAAPLVMVAAPSWNVLPRWQAPVSASSPMPFVQRIASQKQDLTAQAANIDSAVSIAGRIQPPKESRFHHNFVGGIQSRWPLALWAMGFFCLLTPSILGRWSLNRCRRRSPLVTDDSVLACLNSVTKSLGWNRAIQLRICHERAIPMCWGLWKPTILLPSSALQWPKDRLRRVLFHEVGHLKRGDLWTDLVSHVARACYWYHPLFWVARRQLHQLREFACDDLVLASGSNPGDYAEDLLAISAAGRSASSPALHRLGAISMADASGLTQRLHCLLDPRRNDPQRNKPRSTTMHTVCWMIVSVFVLFSVSVLIIGKSPARAQDEAVDLEGEQVSSLPVLSDQGFRLKLIAIGCEQDTTQWWTPTGESLPRMPYENSRGGRAFANGRAVQFVLQELDFDKTDKLVISVDQARATQRQTAESLDGSPVQVFTAFLDETLDRCQLKVLRSSGPWNDALTFRFRNSGAMTSGQIAISVSEPVGDDEQTTVYASIGLNAGDADYRVLAIDVNGDTHVASSIGGGSAKGKRRAALSTIRFNGLDVKDFVGLKLQTRPYAQYTIQDIPVKADSKARPTVLSEDAPPAAKANLTWNTATLPDWENQEKPKHVLDLATGEMHRWIQGRDPVKQALIFSAQRRGDLVWSKELMSLRGTEVLCPSQADWEVIDTVGSLRVYPPVGVQDHLLITTPEGDSYVAFVVGKDGPNSEGLTLKYMRVEDERE